MGLFGKSKKEIEQERLELEDAKTFEENYGISKLHFESLTDTLISKLSTDNLDAIIRLKAPQLNDTINDIFRVSMHNQEQLDKLEKMLERGVYTAVAGQAHDMQVFAMLLGVAEGRLNFRVLENRAVLTSAVDLNEVLIYDTTCTNIKVTNL
jgi:hypothetical protein